jgi:hypothetical protein
VLIDPRVTEDGVTLADLQEQFEHNMRMRELVTGVNQLVTRVRDAQTKLRNTATADSEMTTKVSALAAKLLTEPVRYGKPGLQAHNNLSGEHDCEYRSKDRARRDRTIRDSKKRVRCESVLKLIGYWDRRSRPAAIATDGRFIRRLRRLHR